MKHSAARRISTLFIVSVIFTSIVLAALAPLLTPTTTAQTNPQTTDIFTGQFIPAYFGAAYDPTEAYKQMVGMPVLVFAYDTWGKVVNNFAYETQIKADGSFQAAALPNASHYGICVPVSDAGVSSNFRPPKPEDGIQSAFAYSQQEFPSDAGTVNTQLAKPAKLTNINGEQGCRTFLTSSRTVDISNHINIFPLVPTSVLSIIISDSDNTNDFFNYNKPYEVYAQRVALNNTHLESTGGLGSSDDGGLPGCRASDFDSQTCEASYNEKFTKDNSIADGPIIRGRTIAYNPVDGDGNQQGSGTIFQAFAPRGVYAITYWRPDSRSSNAKMTYLTYDGVSSIGSSFNGIAIEEVRYAGAYLESNAWKALSTRSAEADLETRSEAWLAQSGTINLWGMVTRGEGGKVVPQAGVDIKVNSDKVGFMHIDSRSCGKDGATLGKDQFVGESSKTGLFILSSACSSQRQSAGEQQGSIETSIGVLKTQSDSIDFREQVGVSVNINGDQGPSRRDMSLSVIPDDSIAGILKRDGRPFAFASVDLLVNGKRYEDVAQADSTGYFYIPSGYFSDNPYVSYQIEANPSYSAPNFSHTHENTYALDISQVLAAKNGKGGNLGTVAINSRQPGTVQSFLANLSLSNLMAKLRIPTAFAQTKTDEFDGSQVITMDRDGNTIWRFEVDQSSIGSHRHLFNMANYSLKTVEINPPVDGVDYAKGNSEYEFFVTGGDHGGIWLVTDNAPSGATEDSYLIRGVELKEKTGTDVRFTDMFRDLGTDRLRFNLRVRFEYNGGTTTVGASQLNDETLEGAENIVNNQDTNSGQTEGTTPPKVLQATWPIEVYALDPVPTENDPDDNPSTTGLTRFSVVYDPIVLEIETPNCGGGSLLKNGVADVFKNLMCKTVMGLINGMKTAINWIADNFLTVDPLGHKGSDTVIKYWNVIRNLVNSLAVLILLVAGVAIMLQYEPTTYNLQSVLRKLIIAIVLVNFSILVIQLAVDVANVVAMGGYFMLNQAFETDSSGLSHASAAIGAITASITMMILAAAASGFSGFIAIIIFVFAILILLIYVAYKIAVQYYFRLVTLWICIILAPAAFAARVLPGTASYFGKWKNVVVGTLVAQLALSLMLGLSLAMIVAVKTANSGTEAFLSVIASFVLLYMATKLPNKAAAMMGSDLAGSLETMARSGLTAASGRVKTGLTKSIQSAAKRNARYQEEKLNTNYTGLRRFSYGALKQGVNRRKSDFKQTSIGNIATAGEGKLSPLAFRQKYNAALQEFSGISPEEMLSAQEKGRTEYVQGQKAGLMFGNELAQQSENYGAMLQAKEDVDDKELTGLTGITKARRATAGRIRRLGGRFLNPQGQAILTMNAAAFDGGANGKGVFHDKNGEKLLTSMKAQGGTLEKIHGRLKEATAAQLQIGITDSTQFEQIFRHAADSLTVDERKELGLSATGVISGPDLMKGVVQQMGAEMREIYPEEAANAYVDIVTRKYLNKVDPTGTQAEYIARTAARSERGTNPMAAAGGARAPLPGATGLTVPTTHPAGVSDAQIATDVSNYNALAAVATPTPIQLSQLNTLRTRLQNQYGYH